MDRHDFQTTYTTEFIDNFGTKILFNPLHSISEGSMITTTPNGESIGGTYQLREDSGNIYLGWKNIEFLFYPTEVGFNLIKDKVIRYTFVRS